MNNFIVPQFIDVEDRIIGPITVRQFLVCTVGGLIIFISYKLSDFSLFILEFIVIFPLTLLFAFIRVNGKNFNDFLVDLLIYFFKTPRFAIWQKTETILKKRKQEVVKKDDYVFVPKAFPRAKLNEISLIIDTGGAYIGEDEDSATQAPLQNLR